MGVLYFNAPWKFQEQILPAPPELYQGVMELTRIVERSLAESKIKQHPSHIRRGGLNRVLDGIENLRKRKERSWYTSYNIDMDS
jgi:hypothetical protein